MDDGLRLQSLFQTLGDANRLRIIRIIGTQTRSVSEIAETTGLSQPLVSHHLRILRDQGILRAKREGPFVYYELHDGRILDALGVFSEILITAGVKRNPREIMFSCGDQIARFLNRRRL